MVDVVSPEVRSRLMAGIRGKNTKPEMIVRRLLHVMGYRYRLHAQDLPGRPDVVFRRRRAVIFVHGCFWHRHSDSECKLSRLPKTRLDFWLPKLDSNQKRDEANREALQKMGWKQLVLWECQLRDEASLRTQLKAFLGP